MNNLGITFVATALMLALFFFLVRYDRHRAVTAQVGFFRRNGALVGTYLVLGVGIWMLFTFIMPMVFMVDLSFHHKLPPSKVGGPEDVYTLDNYRMFLFGSTTSTDSLNWLHLRSFFMTIFISILITLVTFAIAYPLAYYMAQVARMQVLRLLLLLLVIPYWVNDILRAFAFRIVMAENGFLNQFLQGIGLTHGPIDFLGQNIALYVALCYSHLLLMTFPLYNAIEAQDHNQIEAARDLGAPWWHIHLFVVMPHAKPGIASGMTLCFMLTAGAVATPMVLGGPNSLWFTPIVYDRFYQLFDWPQGAAYAIVLLLACIAFVFGVLKLTGLKLGEITK
ncbi:ABC transporter permease [Pseudooceanicola sp. CBS1P-1]|uniref:ABC transporter permease subunit n=1 Tax=Pseudooceanicola albus TaxID=2692189 RepID=A0A6L7G5K0_9RHOB|nr:MULTISPECIES: ABC transporter permease [Pseudooceanicola]MBT9385383.1 ABC transporter permease [Pseudooceanicola endophyticus]MXN18758.1 ABC transporter permease subunit [Pseudooceanicola albus]